MRVCSKVEPHFISTDKRIKLADDVVGAGCSGVHLASCRYPKVEAMNKRSVEQGVEMQSNIGPAVGCSMDVSFARERTVEIAASKGRYGRRFAYCQGWPSRRQGHVCGEHGTLVRLTMSLAMGFASHVGVNVVAPSHVGARWGSCHVVRAGEGI